jgi:hypothetical protein
MSGGRPSKYTPETVTQILEYLKVGNTRGTAGQASGISHQTFAVWLREYPEFSEAVKEAEAEAVALHVGNIVNAASKGSWQASAWVLERRHYADWGKKDRIELVNSVRSLAKDNGIDENDAVGQAETILRELRSQARK